MIKIPQKMKNVASRIYPLGYSIMEAWIDKREWGDQYSDAKDLRKELSLTDNDTVCDAYIKIKPPTGNSVSILLEITGAREKDINKMLDQLKETYKIIITKDKDIDYSVIHGANIQLPFKAEKSDYENRKILTVLGKEPKLTSSGSKSIKVFVV